MMISHEDPDYSLWVTDNSIEDLSSVEDFSLQEDLSYQGSESEPSVVDAWKVLDNTSMGQQCWRKRNSIGTLSSFASVDFDDAAAGTSVHIAPKSLLPRLCNSQQVNTSVGLSHTNSDFLIGDHTRQMYLMKLRKNSDRSKFGGDTLPHTVFPERPPKISYTSVSSQDASFFMQKLTSQPQLGKHAQSPIPLRATLHRSSSGRHQRTRSYGYGEKYEVGSFQSSHLYLPIENNLKTLDLDNYDEVDAVNASVVDAVVCLGSKSAKNSRIPTRSSTIRKSLGSGDLSAAIQNVEDENPFSRRKAVLVKSPSLSRLRQRSNYQVEEDMGNNPSHVDGGDDFQIGSLRQSPLTNNSRKIKVKSPSKYGVSNNVSGLDSSQSSGKSIISVSHASSPTDLDEDIGGRHLPEVQIERRHRLKYTNHDNLKSRPSMTPSNIVRSQQRYQIPDNSYEDDFELTSSDSSVEENIQDPMSLSISKITRDKLLQRQGQLIKEAEERRAALKASIISKPIPKPIQKSTPPKKASSQPKSKQTPKRLHVPRKKQKNDQVSPSRSRSLAPSNRFSNHQTRSQSRDRGKSGGFESRGNESSYRSLSDSSAGFSLEKVRISPVANPSDGLKSALRSMSSDNWTVKIEGIQTLLSIASYHHNVMSSDLHNIVLAVNAEVKNLRSSVSRLAIHCVSEMFNKLKRSMDHDAELLARTLFHKSGENSGFIREDVETALVNMIQNVSPSKAAFVIVVAGASHRNGAVRKMAALCLFKLVERVGPAKILSESKEFTEKVLPTAAQFLIDGNPMTRYYSKKVVHSLMNNANFERCLKKYVQASTLRNISNALESLRQKGVGECPLESSSSAKSRLQDLHSRGSNLSKTM